MSKGALYRKMVQYGIKLSTKHPSETNNNFENSYLKSIIYSVKIELYNILIKIEIFCNKKKKVLVLNSLPTFGSACF